MAEKEKNHARIRIEDDFAPVFPSNDIICKDCVFKDAGIMGFKNANCQVYTPEIADKPLDILFKDAKCKYYMKEEDDE